MLDFKFTLDLVPEATIIMLQCMAGIFIVLGVIYLVSMILQKMFPGK